MRGSLGSLSRQSNRCIEEPAVIGEKKEGEGEGEGTEGDKPAAKDAGMAAAVLDCPRL